MGSVNTDIKRDQAEGVQRNPEVPKPVSVERDKSELKAALAKVDNYHPVFGLEDEFVEYTERKISRLCQDRCEFLGSILGRDVGQIRILDVGCSMGYLSLFFASRGAIVTGIDNNPNQIAFCKALANYHKLAPTFRTTDFDKSFCSGLAEGQYDVVFLFSVLHHVVVKYGLEVTQGMMSSLLDVADVQIEKLGEFPALNGVVSRPMYKVWRTKKTFNSVVHSPLEVRRSRVNEVNQPDRKYYLGPRVFTKVFIFDNLRRDTWPKFAAEVYVYQQLGTGTYACKFLGSEIRGRIGLISIERITGGSTLMDQIVSKKIVDLANIAQQVVDILTAFYRKGLYWNDFRSHNIVVSDGKLTAIDFEHASPFESENTLNLFLWLLYDLQSGNSMTHKSGIFGGNNMNIPVPPLELNQFLPELRSLAQRALKAQDIRDFIEMN